MEWVGVDLLHQVVTRDEAMDFIPWLSVRWQTSPPDSGHYFWWDDKGLALKSAAIDARSSVHVDFLHGARARRVKAANQGAASQRLPSLSSLPHPGSDLALRLPAAAAPASAVCGSGLAC